MRIISKFHDYYDVLNDGTDTAHVWKRETTSFLPDLNDRFFQDRNWQYAMTHQMDAVASAVGKSARQFVTLSASLV